MRKGLVMSAVGALAGGVLVAVPLLAGGAVADDSASTVEKVVVGAAVPAELDDYVAFGDSFVSGPGIQPQKPDSCQRSEKNFPSLIAAGLGTTEFVDASCGGAKTEHLTEEQARGVGTNPPQLDSLTTDTTLITFGTLGGNDMGLVGLAMSCALGDCGPGLPGDASALDGIEEARTNMVAGIQEAAAKASDADIFVIGYSTYLLDGGCAVATGLGITPGEADYLQGMIDNLSDMLADVAEQEGVEFVDMREIPGVAEHTACAEPEKQWIRAAITYEDGERFHPSACGMDASAQHILNAIRVHRGQEEVPFDGSCVSAGPAPTAPTGPTVKERKQALTKALKTAKLKTTCRAGKATFQVKGGKKLVHQATFKVGKHKVTTDRKKPFKVTKKVKKLAKYQGRIKAVVQVRDAELRVQRTIKAKRPSCL